MSGRQPGHTRLPTPVLETWELKTEGRQAEENKHVSRGQPAFLLSWAGFRSRLSFVVKAAWVIVVLAVAGCDSIVGDERSSADGGACSVIYVYVDGGVAAGGLDASGEIPVGGEGTVSFDADSSTVDADDSTIVDAMVGVDLGAARDAVFYDFSRDVARDGRADGPVDSPMLDLVPDQLAADSVAIPADQAVAKPDSRPNMADVAGVAEVSNDRPSADVPTIVDLPGVSDVRDTASGLNQDVALSSDVQPKDTRPHPIDFAPSPVDVDGPVVVSQVGTGLRHSCALRNDGVVYCWGENYAGQTSPPVGAFFVQIDSAYYSNCGVKLNHALACWGGNNQGQAKPPSGEFLSVAMGSLHGCGIKNDGTVVCWGNNDGGQGNAPPGTFVQLTAGDLHTCGIQSDGTTACWGDNGSGQSAVPTGVFVQVSARRLHTCALKDDNTLACWGSNSDGESTPPSGTFVQVAAGYFNACAVRSDGTIACWGSDSAGQSTPPSGAFLSVSVESDHACAVRSDGTVACWGNDSSGQSSPP